MLPYRAQTGEQLFLSLFELVTGDTGMKNTTKIRFGLIGLGVLTSMLGGCRLVNRFTNNDIDSTVMTERLRSAPPVMGSSLEGRHMLVMRAPNPGWGFEIDRDDRDRDGWVIFLTIREPDPAYMHPQRIVNKRLLTEVEADQPVRVMTRLLHHDEKGESDDYAPMSLVDSFEP